MKKRLISSVIALIIFVPLIILGGLTFEITCALLSIVGVREIFNLIRKDSSIPFSIELISYILTGLLVLSEDMYSICALIIFLFLFIPLVFFKENKYNFSLAIKLFGTILFIGTSFYLISTTRIGSLDELIYLLSISFATDIFAYLGGRMFGKRKLIERVSPNKTVEGALIGTAFGTLIPTIVYLFMVDTGENIFIIILFTLGLSIMGQLGDLVFSAIKRSFKVKDYSNLMPGHGGVLDRLDSLIFITIAYTIIRNIFL